MPIWAAPRPSSPPLPLLFLSLLLLLTPRHSRAAGDNASFGAGAGAAVGYRACDCWSRSPHDGRNPEVECRCSGSGPVVAPHGVNNLMLSDPGLELLGNEVLRPYADSLQDLTLIHAYDLRKFETDVFRQLPLLRTVYISEAPALRTLPDDLLEGVTAHFRTLRVVRTGLAEVPQLRGLPHNVILHMMILSYNSIEVVQGWAFNGSEIAKLSLKGNRALTRLEEDAFSGLSSLRDLDLSDTSITHLPTRGLGGLEILRIRDTPTLMKIPSVYNFKHLREAWLTYSFHCCAFEYPARHDPVRHALQQEYEAALRRRCRQNASLGTALEAHGLPGNRRRRQADTHDDDFPPNSYDVELPPSGSGDGMFEDDWPHLEFLPGLANSQESREDDDDDDEDIMHGFFHATTAQPRRHQHAMCGNISTRIAVRCRPTPDALNPCEDIMGSVWLRASVWVVVVTAVLGNAAVLAVLLAAPRNMSPSKFLMCNLAFADFCMGVYLLLLASADAHSQSAYFNFAYRWQRGIGCMAAGFLTVFASQLSVYTLAVLTLERWVAITYALYLNKRLKLRASMYIMGFGWIYSLSMAALPLIGVSNYSSTSICLPMETGETQDVAYLVSLLVTNALAFAVVCICYLQIYLSLGRDTRHSGRGGVAGGIRRRGELTVAKRMALLVFTDFACWAPIAFFGLTAVAGYPLIDVTRSKILLVFFYPLNSCANPYLYALLTKQYRRDLLDLLSGCGVCTKAARKYKAAYSLPTTNQTQPQQTIIRATETTASGTMSTTLPSTEVTV